jgi:hypothetical protein
LCWVTREAKKVRDLSYGDRLRDFSSGLAREMWEQRKQRNGLYIDYEEIRVRAERGAINLHALTEHDISSRSLLNRTADGKLKFAHKSILEYFLALLASAELALANEVIDADDKSADQAKRFLAELIARPFPAGRLFEGTFAELRYSLFSAEAAQRSADYLLVREPDLRMVCGLTTPPSSLKTVLLLDEPVTVHICYRNETELSVRIPGEWADEVSQADRVDVFLSGAHVIGGRQVIDGFVAAFQEKGIQSRLSIPMS